MALVIAGSLASMAPASAVGRDRDRAQGVLVSVTGDGSHGAISSRWVHPGWLKLNIKNSTIPNGSVDLVVVKMKDHYPVKRLVADINVQVNQNSTPNAAAASTRDINKIAIALGGGDTYGQAQYFRSGTIWLPNRGEFYVLNTSATGGVAVLGRLDADGRTVFAGAPSYSGLVTLGHGRVDNITLRGYMPPKGTIKVRNDGDSVHLLQFQKVADGVTDRQVQHEYNIIMGGGTPTSDPAGLTSPPTTPGTGSDAVTPGQSSLLSYNLPRGTYLLQCFVSDATTGLPHAFMGMHRIVHIR